MSGSKGSFWASVPGVITGIAGLLTAIVGLIAVLVQLGVLGGDSDTTTGATTTVPGAGGAGTATTQAPRFAISPSSLDFPAAGPRTKSVKVTNEASSAPLLVSSPRITGTDRAEFSVSSGDCNAPLRPGSSCELQVTFSPSGTLRSYQATLEVSPEGARTQEVRLTASTVLG